MCHFLIYLRNERLHRISLGANTWSKHQLNFNCKYTDMKIEEKTNLNRMPFYQGLLLHCLFISVSLKIIYSNSYFVYFCEVISGLNNTIYLPAKTFYLTPYQLPSVRFLSLIISILYSSYVAYGEILL